MYIICVYIYIYIYIYMGNRAWPAAPRSARALQESGDLLAMIIAITVNTINTININKNSYYY